MFRPYFKDVTVLILLALINAFCAARAGVPSEDEQHWVSEREVQVRMRDGVRLATDVYLPKGNREKLPTLLIRTPYGKAGQWPATREFVDHYLSNYAVVVQDERGLTFSEGIYNNYLQGASTDGYDTIQWVVKHQWSNGKVGSLGCSSTGETQLPMAASGPPGLAAIVPGASGAAIGNIPGNTTRGAFYRGGVPLLRTWANWYQSVPTERPVLPASLSQEERIRLRNTYASLIPKQTLAFNPIAELMGKNPDLSPFMKLPSKDVLRQGEGSLTPFDNYITWTPADTRWNEVETLGENTKIPVPSLYVTTWHDMITAGEMTRLFKYLQDLETRNQYLIVGAGPHCAFEARSTELGADLTIKTLKSSENPSLLASWLLDLKDLEFGDLHVGDARYGGADHGYAKLFSRWFEYWLQGKQNNVLEMPKVQLFVMGKGWVAGDRWPLKETRFTKYYLSSNSSKDLTHDAGMLSIEPARRDDVDSYVYDPADPTPSRGGGDDVLSALDQRPVEIRKDVLTYSTPPLGNSVTIAGPIEVTLYVSSSAKDTDFMVKLVDVYPDGKAINLTDDAFRVRYREGFDRKVLMQPDGVYRITLPNMVTAMRFAVGHRIRLEVASSSFPYYERNLNTGGNNYDETTWVVAENSVHHGPQYPSHVVLPIIPEQLGYRESDAKAR